MYKRLVFRSACARFSDDERDMEREMKREEDKIGGKKWLARRVDLTCSSKNRLLKSSLPRLPLSLLLHQNFFLIIFIFIYLLHQYTIESCSKVYSFEAKVLYVHRPMFLPRTQSLNCLSEILNILRTLSGPLKVNHAIMNNSRVSHSQKFADHALDLWQNMSRLRGRLR